MRRWVEGLSGLIFEVEMEGGVIVAWRSRLRIAPTRTPGPRLHLPQECRPPEEVIAVVEGPDTGALEPHGGKALQHVSLLVGVIVSRCRNRGGVCRNTAVSWSFSVGLDRAVVSVA